MIPIFFADLDYRGSADNAGIVEEHVNVAKLFSGTFNHAAAIRGAQAFAGHLVRIEVEVDTLDQLEAALAAGADAILLDNMPPETLRRAVALTGGRAILEASGGITLDNVAAVAESGVDFISSGALTHSVRALDLGLDVTIG